MNQEKPALRWRWGGAGVKTCGGQFMEELRSGRLQGELDPAYCKQPSSSPVTGVKNS